MKNSKKNFSINLSCYESTPLAFYQFNGNTKKIPFIPFLLSVSKLEAFDVLEEIDNECDSINVIVLKDKIIFENHVNEHLWTIESLSPESNNNLSVEYIEFINAEKDSLNLNYLEDIKRNIVIFKDSNI